MPTAMSGLDLLPAGGAIDIGEGCFMKKESGKQKTPGARKTKPDPRSSAAQSAPAPVGPGGILWLSLVLIALNLFIYAPALNSGFLTWDDPGYVTKNAEVLRGLTWQGLQWAFTTGHASNWHPLTWLSHMLDVQFYGEAAGLHHLTNILLHIANTLLLFWALCRMTGTWRPGVVVAALFAVHPMHVESVAWVAERKDVLSALFFMLTLHAYIRYVRRPRPGGYLAVAAFFALGLMSKPMLVTLPFVLLLLDFWPLRRAQLEPGQKRRWLLLVREKIPLFALSAASSIVTIVVQSQGGAVASLRATPLGDRLANVLVSYSAYVFKMLWPADLVAYYPYRLWPWSLAVGSGLLLIAATFFSIRLARKHPHLLVGWLWYLGMLLPVIGLIQVGDQAMADRYTYLPFIGLFIVAVWSAPLLLSRWRHRNAVLLSAAVILIGVLAASARAQVRYWKSDLALWTHTVEKRGNDNFVAHTKLGAALASLGRFAPAIEQYTAALRINPEMDEALTSLGLVYFRQGRLGEALAQYNEAVRFNPRYAEAYINRGIVLGVQGKRSQAIEDFRAALKMSPDNAEVHYNLGYALAENGQTDEAVSHFNEALRINPGHAQARNRMGTILALQGRLGEAIEQYTRALSIRGDFLEARVNLGVALMNRGRDSEALTQFMEALRINPDQSQVHNNVGVLLINQGRRSDAVAHFKEALRLSPDSLDIQENLKNAMAGPGKNP